jgi:hypothetical protein
MRVTDVISAYGNWIKENSENSLQVYLVTFQFNHLGKNGIAALEFMRKEIERFYVVLLSNVVRRPRRPSHLVKLPRLIAIPDRPTSKRISTYSLSDVRPNDGVHFHALIAIPKVSRLRGDLFKHIQRNKMRFLGNQGKIMNIDVRPIGDPDGRLVDYAFKHIKRKSFSLDDILVLPKSQSEL